MRGPPPLRARNCCPPVPYFIAKWTVEARSPPAHRPPGRPLLLPCRCAKLPGPSPRKAPISQSPYNSQSRTQSQPQLSPKVLTFAAAQRKEAQRRSLSKKEPSQEIPQRKTHLQEEPFQESSKRKTQATKNQAPQGSNSPAFLSPCGSPPTSGPCPKPPAAARPSH